LADFSSSSPITIKAETYYNSGYNVISSTSGEKWTMSNQNNANVSPSSISSGAFNETWSTSAGTDKTCVPPRTGDLVISGSCTLPNNADAQANVEVQSGSNVLTIPNGFKLTIPFSTNHLLVHGPTGGVLIKHGGTISTH
jgi:hypothetical protein